MWLDPDPRGGHKVRTRGIVSKKNSPSKTETTPRSLLATPRTSYGGNFCRHALRQKHSAAFQKISEINAATKTKAPQHCFRSPGTMFPTANKHAEHTSLLSGSCEQRSKASMLYHAIIEDSLLPRSNQSMHLETKTHRPEDDLAETDQGLPLSSRAAAFRCAFPPHCRRCPPHAGFFQCL